MMKVLQNVLISARTNEGLEVSPLLSGFTFDLVLKLHACICNEGDFLPFFFTPLFLKQ